MTAARTFGVLTLFAGLGAKTLGVLRARGPNGERFESVGAFEIWPDACADFQHLTGASATEADIGLMTPGELADRCTRRPDLVVASPPCKSWSACLSEAKANTPEYAAMGALALRSLDLVLEAWTTPPALILLENVPRILSRGRKVLEQMKALLRAKGYAVDLRVHDCGTIGGLAQSRQRVLLVARHIQQVPTSLLYPPEKPLRPMSEVLWRLPVPTPGSTEGGSLHRLPKLSALNALRLAVIRAGHDWRDLPEEIRIGGGPNTHAGKYGVQDPDDPAHAVIAEARTGKGWADVADPRVRQRAGRQNGGYGVNDSAIASHAIVGEGSVGNTWASVNDPRLGCSPRNGTMGVLDGGRPSSAILSSADMHNNSAASVADPRVVNPRSDCDRREGSLGVCPGDRALYTSVIANGDLHNGPWQIADPRVAEQHRGSFGVQDPADARKCVQATHDVRTAPGSVADGRDGFEPTHRLLAGQALDVGREEWTNGRFDLLGPPVEFARKGRPVHLIILAPDGTVHRPLTPLELAALQSLPVWHRPGDPTRLPIGAPGGQWLQLAGKRKAGWVERIGNAVPPDTAEAFATEALAALAQGATEVFRLSAGGVWVDGEGGRDELTGGRA